jgi:hypothetical protein
MLPLNAALSMILFDLGAAFEKRCSEERRPCAGCLWPVTREDLPARPCAGYGRECRRCFVLSDVSLAFRIDRERR